MPHRQAVLSSCPGVLRLVRIPRSIALVAAFLFVVFAAFSRLAVVSMPYLADRSDERRRRFSCFRRSSRPSHSAHGRGAALWLLLAMLLTIALLLLFSILPPVHVLSKNVSMLRVCGTSCKDASIHIGILGACNQLNRVQSCFGGSPSASWPGAFSAVRPATVQSTLPTRNSFEGLMIIVTLVFVGLGTIVCLWAIISRRRAFEVLIPCGYAEEEQ